MIKSKIKSKYRSEKIQCMSKISKDKAENQTEKEIK